MICLLYVILSAFLTIAISSSETWYVSEKSRWNEEDENIFEFGEKQVTLRGKKQNIRIIPNYADAVHCQ